MVRRKAKNPARYLYDSPEPGKGKFLGKFENGFLNPKPDVKGDPWNQCVAVSPNNKNDYPPQNRIIKPADEIKDSSGKMIGYAFRYI